MFVSLLPCFAPDVQVTKEISPTGSVDGGGVYRVDFEAGYSERLPHSDLQILLANGDTRRQAKLAYDKDICQVCLRGDEGQWPERLLAGWLSGGWVFGACWGQRMGAGCCTPALVEPALGTLWRSPGIISCAQIRTSFCATIPCATSATTRFVWIRL